jgi:hypothetical protein
MNSNTTPHTTEGTMATTLTKPQMKKLMEKFAEGKPAKDQPQSVRRALRNLEQACLIRYRFSDAENTYQWFRC